MRRSLLSVGLAAIVILFWPATALAAIRQVGLGTAGNYAVLAGQSITNSGFTWISGKMGVSPGSSLTGFPPGASGPRDVANARAGQAEADLTTAYLDAKGRTPCKPVSPNLTGRTLVSGLYCAGTMSLNGELRLSGGGVFIFQIAAGLTTTPASGAWVHLINGASPCQVFWQVGSSATIGSSAAFVGTIMALTSISMGTRATLEGRALARNGSVTLLTNRIIMPGGCGYNAPPLGSPNLLPPPGAVPPLPITLGFSLSIPSNGVPLELRGQEFPWLLVIGLGAGAGVIAMGVIARRRRRTA
jgi:Ice-binding-like